MQSIFEEYLLKNNVNARHHSVLCAVSGGLDSMVMAHLFYRMGFSIGLAHVNHRTRGKENEREEALVKQTASDWQVKCFVHYLEEKIVQAANFQANAREIRYAFLEDMREQNGFDYIATAHHADDDVETLLINLLRGSGIKGLTGIPAKNHNILRPLLGISKDALIDYRDQHGIAYLEDSSNQMQDYLRNYLRLHVMPGIEARLPGAKKGLHRSLHNLKNDYKLLSELLHERDLVEVKEASLLKIRKSALEKLVNGETALYHLIKPYGFNADQAVDIMRSERTGSSVLSTGFRLVNDRQHFTLMPRNNRPIFIEVHETGTFMLDDGRKITVELIPASQGNSHSYYFDARPFPFILRGRKEGDRIRIDHLNGKHKRIKKMCNDLKLDSDEKNRLILLEKEGEVLAVHPHARSLSAVKSPQSKWAVNLSVSNG